MCLANKDPLIVVLQGPASTPFDEPSLRTSLLVLLRENPILRARLDRRGTQPVLQPQGASDCDVIIEIYAPLEEDKASFEDLTFSEQVIYFEADVRERLSTHLTGHSTPSIHLYYCEFFPTQPHLALAIDHLNCDGDSAALILNRLINPSCLQHADAGTGTEALAYAREYMYSPGQQARLPLNFKKRQSLYESSSALAPPTDIQETHGTGTEQIFEISESIRRSIERNAQALDTSINNLVISALGLTLYRLHQTPDFHINTASSGRHSPVIQATIGSFATMSPLAFHIDEQQTLNDYLSSVNMHHMLAHYQSEIPFSKRSFLETVKAFRDTMLISFDSHQISPDVVYGVGKSVEQDWTNQPFIKKVVKPYVRRWPAELRFRMDHDRWYARLYTADDLYTPDAGRNFYESLLKMCKAISEDYSERPIKTLIDSNTID